MSIVTSIATSPSSQASPEQHREFNQVNNSVSSETFAKLRLGFASAAGMAKPVSGGGLVAPSLE